MDPAETFAFGAFRFCSSRNQLTRDGTTVPLGARAAEVLACLLRNAGQTVSKAALMAAVWPDRVVEDHNLTVHLSAVRRALGEGTSGARFIQTDTGRGYRFIAPVSGIAQVSGIAAPAAAPSRRSARPSKPSIAVLPFDNMSSDPEQLHFADGMVDDITTELSRYPALFVIARNSSFTWRGKTRDMREVGAELGARYLLEGSVRRGGGRVRVTAQLIDSETGGHVWAERYDRDISDMFTVQDEITQAVAMAIEPAVRDAEGARAVRRPPDNLDAWETFHRGLHFMEQVDPESSAVARELFQRAIELDPGFAPPRTHMAVAHLDQIWMSRAPDPGVSLEIALREATHAVSLAPDDAAAYAALAWALFTKGDVKASLTRADHAVALNPNSVAAHRVRSVCLMLDDQLRESREVALLCLRLSPRAPRSWMGVHHLMIVDYMLGDYQSAAEWSSRLSNIRSRASDRWLVAILGQLGRVEEAQGVMRRWAEPGLTFDDLVRERGPWLSDERYAHLLEGLRLAGWRG